MGLEFIGGKTRRRSYGGLRIRAHASAWAKPFNSVINSSRSSVVIARMSHCFFWGVELEMFVSQFLPICPFLCHLKQRPSSLCLFSSSSKGDQSELGGRGFGLRPSVRLLDLRTSSWGRRCPSWFLRTFEGGPYPLHLPFFASRPCLSSRQYRGRWRRWWEWNPDGRGCPLRDRSGFGSKCGEGTGSDGRP